MILLAGGTKKRQARDIEKAQALWNEYKQGDEMPIREYDASEYLKTPEDIAEYLNAVMEEMDDDPRLLMIALRNVVKARGGISALARQADLNRVALSRTLSGQRIPRLDTFAKVSAACGVKLRFSA